MKMKLPVMIALGAIGCKARIATNDAASEDKATVVGSSTRCIATNSQSLYKLSTAKNAAPELILSHDSHYPGAIKSFENVRSKRAEGQVSLCFKAKDTSVVLTGIVGNPNNNSVLFSYEVTPHLAAGEWQQLCNNGTRCFIGAAVSSKDRTPSILADLRVDTIVFETNRTGTPSFNLTQVDFLNMDETGKTAVALKMGTQFNDSEAAKIIATAAENASNENN